MLYTAQYESMKVCSGKHRYIVAIHSDPRKQTKFPCINQYHVLLKEHVQITYMHVRTRNNIHSNQINVTYNFTEFRKLLFSVIYVRIFINASSSVYRIKLWPRLLWFVSNSTSNKYLSIKPWKSPFFIEFTCFISAVFVVFPTTIPYNEAVCTLS